MSSKRVLIMGLSGTGKTTLSKKLSKELNAEHINADEVRSNNDDWDFSLEGRLRQSRRINKLSLESKKDYVVMDFICPLKESRKIINADYVIWMDTETRSDYKDTDSVFVEPDYFDVKFTSKNGFDTEHLVKTILGL